MMGKCVREKYSNFSEKNRNPNSVLIIFLYWLVDRIDGTNQEMDKSHVRDLTGQLLPAVQFAELHNESEPFNCLSFPCPRPDPVSRSTLI